MDESNVDEMESLETLLFLALIRMTSIGNLLPCWRFFIMNSKYLFMMSKCFLKVASSKEVYIKILLHKTI